MTQMSSRVNYANLKMMESSIQNCEQESTFRLSRFSRGDHLLEGFGVGEETFDIKSIDKTEWFGLWCSMWQRQCWSSTRACTETSYLPLQWIFLSCGEYNKGILGFHVRVAREHKDICYFKLISFLKHNARCSNYKNVNNTLVAEITHLFC